MLDKLDYCYNDVDSIVHRINPIVKWIGFLFYILFLFLKYNNIVFICNMVFIFLLMLLSNVSYVRYLRVIWNLKYFIIIYYLFTLNTLNMELYDVNILMFKALFLIIYVKVIIFTTSKESMGKGIAYLLNIFNLIGISIRKIEMFFINIFTFVLCFITNHNETVYSMEFKGIQYGYSNLFHKMKFNFSNIKRVHEVSKNDMAKRKKGLFDKLYNSKLEKKYKYRSKFNLFDILYLLYYICLLTFYVLVVR